MTYAVVFTGTATRVDEFKNRNFRTYEAARSFVRKVIRKIHSPAARVNMDFGYGELEYYNPAMTEYGFSVKRV